jgi:nicotinamide riboside kinase
MQYSSFIICGLDRLGKSTLIENLQHRLGYFSVFHYERPKKLKCLGHDLFSYQKLSFENGFRLISSPQSKIIFDRFHLGETVYSPLYRGYSGEYVFDLEEEFGVSKMDHVKLILLTTSSFEFVEDDGKSFNVSKRNEEQEMFKEAFAKSSFKHKSIVDVSIGNQFKDQYQILEEALA